MAEDMGLNVKLAMESQGFQKQIADINRSMKVAQSEFSAASSKLGDFGNETDKAKLKMSSLEKQLELQKQIVGKYQEQLNKAKETLEKNTKANEELRNKVQATTKAYNDSVAATGKSSEESKKLKSELDALNKDFKDNQNVINSNTKSIDNYNIKLNNADAAANKLENEIKKTDNSFKNQGKAIQETEKKVEEGKKGFGGLSGAMSAFGKVALVGVTAVAGVTAGLVAMAEKTVDNAAAMKKLSTATQMSLKDTQEWAYIFKKTGSSTDVMQASINKLGITMGKADDNGKKAVGAFKNLGININDAGGKLKPTGQLFEEAMTKLSGMKDMTERNIEAQKLFGGSYTQLLPILNKGSEGIEELRKRAHTLGFVMSDEGVAAAAKYRKSVNDLKEQFGAIGQKVMTELLPYLSKFATWITDQMPTIQAVADKAFNGISVAIKYLGDFINTFLMPIFNTLASWIKPNADSMKNSFNSSFFEIGNALKSVGDTLNKTLMPILKSLSDFVKTNIPNIKKVFEEEFNFISKTTIPIFTAAIGTITQNVLPALGSLFRDIVKNVLPLFTDYWKWMSNTIIPMLQKIFEKIMPPVKEIINNLGILFKALVDKFKEQIDFLTKAFKFAFPFIKGIVESCIKNIGNILSGVMKTLSGIINFITGVFTGDWGKAWKGVKEIFKGVFESLVGIAKAPINLIIGLINGLISHINKIKINIPKIKIPGVDIKLGGGSIGFPTIPKIPYLAQGGITTGPMLSVIGDNKSGKEAVIPLEKLDGIIEKVMKTNQGDSMNNTFNITTTDKNIKNDIAKELKYMQYLNFSEV
jgi:predicted  nucleic acid-binding Zn-ribbon protein